MAAKRRGCFQPSRLSFPSLLFPPLPLFLFPALFLNRWKIRPLKLRFHDKCIFWTNVVDSVPGAINMTTNAIHCGLHQT